MPVEQALLLALVAALVLCTWMLLRSSPQRRPLRLGVCSAALLANAVYFAWRYTQTLPGPWSSDTWMAWTYLGVESLAVLESSLFWVCMSRTREGVGPDVPAPAAPLDAAAPNPRVEIWITTYKEPIEVLQKSVLAALAVDFEDLIVKVLDDGNRPWLREQCAEWGALYLARGANTHAKAGNLNHALLSTEADFLVLMDADFAAFSHFVKTALPYFADPRLAVLQTPQTFYNPDLAQQNLGLGGGIADEQALFFREIQPARDAWDSVLFCGSCAMLRTAAVRDIGGFATESITEDLLTTLRLLSRDWRVRFLNERLSMGLAAESIDAYYLQRDRWSRGAIQTLPMAEGPLRNPGMSLMQRLLFLPFYWLINPFFNLAVMLLPALALLTGLPIVPMKDPMHAVWVILPVVLVNVIALTWISRGRFSPIISTAVSMVGSVRLTISAVVGLGELLGLGTAKGRIFKVTPKGSQIKASSDRVVFGFFLGLTLVTLGAMVYASWCVPSAQLTDRAPAWLLIMACYNLLHFLIAMVLVEDRPRRRAEERFSIKAPMRLQLGAGAQSTQVQVHVEDMSLSGVRFHWESAQPPAQASLLLRGHRLALHDLHPQSNKHGKHAGQNWVARFKLESSEQTSAVIQHLFSGEFKPLVEGTPGWLSAMRQTARAVAGT